MNEPCRRRPLLAMRAQQAASAPQQPEAVLHWSGCAVHTLEITDPAVAEAARAMWSNTADPASVPSEWVETPETPKVRKKPGPKPGSKRKAR